MIDWPPINTLAWLRLPCCREEHPTRIEDYSGEDLVIAAPFAPHVDYVPPLEPDEGFFVAWTGDRAVMEMPVVLATCSFDTLPTWTVKAVGQPTETQRRMYVRVAAAFSVDLQLHDAGSSVKGLSLDISEGGLRCVIDKWAIDPGRKRFKVGFELDGEEYLCIAERAWWGNLDFTEHRIVGVRFLDLDSTESDAIRRWTFATQIEQRRKRSL